MPSLAGEISADVCIVGAGFAGLCTAHFLTKAGARVAVLERNEPGWGASGRNGGQLLPGYLADIRDIYQKFGREKGRAFWELSLQGMDIVKQFIREYEIDCDWKDGAVTTAETEKGQNDLEELAAFWEKELGASPIAWDASTLEKKLGTTQYRFGLYTPHAGHFHPLKYVRNMASRLVAAGGQIYPHSPAERIAKQNGGFVLNTPHGSVRARNVVLCGDSYLGALFPKLRKKYVLIRNAIIATEPLSSGQGVLPCDAAVAESTGFLHFYRKSADNRLLFGGGDLVIPMRSDAATQGRTIKVLKKNIATIFPQLKETAIAFEWGGYVAMTHTYMPNVGMLESGIYYANGFSGHGIGLTHICGKLLAAAISQGDTAYKTFEQVENMSFPGAGQWDYYWTVLGMWLHRLRRHRLAN
jgi:gamma-glutamylputrescine oxidase